MLFLFYGRTSPTIHAPCLSNYRKLLVIVHEPWLLSGIRRFQVWDLLIGYRAQVRFHRLDDFTFNPLILNKTGIVMRFAFILLCKHLDENTYLLLLVSHYIIQYLSIVINSHTVYFCCFSHYLLWQIKNRPQAAQLSTVIYTLLFSFCDC